jgi:hypothetical protein
MRLAQPYKRNSEGSPTQTGQQRKTNAIFSAQILACQQRQTARNAQEAEREVFGHIVLIKPVRRAGKKNENNQSKPGQECASR